MVCLGHESEMDSAIKMRFSYGSKAEFEQHLKKRLILGDLRLNCELKVCFFIGQDACHNE